jgi:hypothetical protein
MMILSRIWYVILAILLAGAYYVVSLAVGQYNRRNNAAMEETLKADSQVVKWALDVDARRRLDALLLAAVDPGVVKAIKGANAARDTVPVGARDEGTKALRNYNEKLGESFRSDALFAVDRDGRLVSQVGFDALAAFPEFELGGYPAVFDALHGFLRDDTWVLGGKIARVVTRPVEDEAGQPPLGAVVALKWVDTSFTKEIGKRTRTNLAFFALGQRVASAATVEGFEENALEAMAADLKAVTSSEAFKKEGRTDVRPLGADKGGVLFVRMPGEIWDLEGGFAVARNKVKIDTALGFISGADDADKKNVKLWIVAVVALGAALIGFLFSFLEHSRPMKEMALQAARLKKGEIDMLQLPRFRGGYRPIAADVNDGIQRVVEKGGGTARKPADLESILGPTPAKPAMSAFSFPDPSAAPQPVPLAPGAAGAIGAPPPSGPGALASTLASSTGAVRPAGAPPPASRPGGPPPPLNRPPVPGAPPPPANRPATPAAPFAAPVAGGAPAPREEDEQTTVAQPSADLIAATGQTESADTQAEWKGVYEEFIRTKQQCGEPTDGLTFEKFQQTLKKNRDALIQRHGCKRVKFSVYVKEGRASLKATPVRE